MTALNDQEYDDPWAQRIDALRKGGIVFVMAFALLVITAFQAWNIRLFIHNANESVEDQAKTLEKLYMNQVRFREWAEREFTRN